MEDVGLFAAAGALLVGALPFLQKFAILLPTIIKGADVGMKAVAFLPKKRKGPAQWITLNVGGTRFLTTKATLLSEPDTLFHYLIQKDPKKPLLRKGTPPTQQPIDVASLVPIYLCAVLVVSSIEHSWHSGECSLLLPAHVLFLLELSHRRVLRGH